jgi:uracil-DNA glycosylase family 4
MSRCALCPNVNVCIPPDGPQRKGILLFIGEAPGGQEDRDARKYPPGKPFVGKTGQEVDGHYLPVAGLRRSEVLFVNAIRCLPPTPGGKLDPDQPKHQALLESCCHRHLYPLISGLQPRLLIPMGQFACRAVFGEAFDLELRHGIPTESPWSIPAFPMYHPALGLHEPKKMLYIRTDWWRLNQYLKGTLHTPTDELAGHEDYQEVTSEKELSASLELDRDLAADTESGRAGPFCLTYSQRPGMGRLIRATRPDLLLALDEKLQRHTGRILFHNWLYDWPVTEAMGLSLPYRRVVDTMARVFHLGNLPQGLKALCFRELGMRMADFDDVVRPHSTQRVLQYLRLAYAEDWPKPDPQIVYDTDGTEKVYKPQSMKTKLKRFFTDYLKSPETKDVFKAWENWEAEHEAIEERLGPFPGMDIAHVPFEQTLHYACRDADGLIRLWPLLKRMPTYVRRYSQEHWRDAFHQPQRGPQRGGRVPLLQGRRLDAGASIHRP